MSANFNERTQRLLKSSQTSTNFYWYDHKLQDSTSVE